MTNKELCKLLSNFPAEALIEFEFKDKLLNFDLEHWQIGEKPSVISFCFFSSGRVTQRNGNE